MGEAGGDHDESKSRGGWVAQGSTISMSRSRRLPQCGQILAGSGLGRVEGGAVKGESWLNCLEADILLLPCDGLKATQEGEAYCAGENLATLPLNHASTLCTPEQSMRVRLRTSSWASHSAARNNSAPTSSLKI